jgi:hypothetical protein
MAQEKPFYPSRNRGRSPNHILGGMHMTHYGYLVYQLLKRMTCTECPQPKKFLDEMATTARSGNWNELEMAWSQPVENWKPRIASLDEIWDRDDVMERQQLVYLPWFYECNRHDTVCGKESRIGEPLNLHQTLSSEGECCMSYELWYPMFQVRLTLPI